MHNFKNTFQKQELNEDLGLDLYEFKYRMDDPQVGRFWHVDPLAEQLPSWSSYSFCFNNPLRFTDPTGMAPDDFVQQKDGSIYWDKNANSQATTKAGETYLGKTLTFSFTSFIDKKLWDGPTLGGLVDPSGVKLNSTITLTGRENDAGELTSMVGTSLSRPGETPMGTPRNYYPGKGGQNNVFDLKTTSTGVSTNFEHHASVSPIEEFGLNSMGYRIVDVAQKLQINYASNTGDISISSYTNVFPSATLKLVNTNTILMNYAQPSFKATHTAPIKGWTSPSPYKDNLGPRPIRDFSYYPSIFYKR